MNTGPPDRATLQRRDAALIGFGLTLVVLVVGGVLGVVSARRLSENERRIAHTYEVVGELEALLSTLKDAETGQRGYLLTADETYLEPYADALRRGQNVFARLLQLTSDNPGQQARLAALGPKIAGRVDELNRTVALMKGGDRPAAMQIVRTDTGKAMMDGLRADVAALRGAEEELLRRRAPESAACFRTTVLSILLPAVIGSVLIGIVFALGRRTRRVRERAARAVAEQAERLRTTLASIGDAVVTTDLAGRVTNMNAVAEALTGWKADDATGRPLDAVFRIVDETTRQPVADPAARAVREGTVVGLANHTVLIARDGTERPIDDSAAPIRCKAGEVVGCVLVFRDVTDRRRHEGALAERARLVGLRADVSSALASGQPTPAVLQHCCEALVRHLDVAFARVWTLDEAAAVLELRASAGLYTHLDGPHGRVPVGQFKIGRIAGTNQPHLTNAVPDDPNVSDQAWAAREGMVAFAGYPLRVDGRVVGVVAMFARRPLTDGVLTELAPLADGIAQYIDRRRADARAREQAEWLRVTLASLGDAVLATDAAGRVTFLNPVAEALTGWSAADAAGVPLEDVFRIVNEATRRPVENPARRALADGVIVGLANHTVLIAKDGTERPIDDSAAPIRDAAGAVGGAVLVFRDVTGRRAAEAVLRQREADLREAQRVARVGSWNWDAATDATTGSDELYRIYGLDPARGPFPDFGCQDGSLYPHASWMRIDAEVRRAVATGVAYELDVVAFRGDESIWVTARGEAVRDAGGAVVGLRGTVQDVTARKRAEDQMARLAAEAGRERRLFETVLANTPDFMYTVDLDGRFTYVNAALLALWGKGRAEAVGKNFFDLEYPPELAARLQRQIRQVIDTRRPVRDETPYTGADGEREYEYILTPVPGAGGKVEAVAGSTRDITDRKRAEAALFDQGERLQAALDGSRAGTFRWDIRTDALDWDENLDRLFGLPPGKTIRSLATFIATVHPDERAGVIERCQRCARDGADFDMEFRVLWPDGTVRWLDDKGKTVLDPAGRPQYMAGMCIDVTDRKRAEDLVRASEERFRAVVAATSDILWTNDAAGRMTGEQPGWGAFTGQTAEEYQGYGWAAAVHPDDARPTIDEWERAVAEKRTFVFEHRVRRRDGEWRTCSIRAVPVLGPAGEIREWVGVHTDVTEQYQAEQAVRASDERLRMALTAARMVAWQWNPVEDQAVFSDNAADVFGLPPGSTIEASTQAYPLVHPGDVDRHRATITGAVREGGSYTTQFRMVRRDTGAVIWLEEWGHAVRDGRGTTVRLVGIDLDITERKRAEEEVRRLAADLAAADRRKDDFLATLAHELRNPLAPIRNGLRVLALTADRPDLAGPTRDMMDRQVTQLVRLVDDLLDVSRIGRGKLDLRRRPVDLAAAVRDAVETSRPLVEAQGHDLAVDLPAAPLVLDADAARLAQVFANLLTNAAKYTDRGGRLRLVAEQRGAEAVVRVSDTGVGIPADMLPKVFDLFTQVDGSLEKAQGGLGIGLSLVKGLVEMHGGTVEAFSDGPGRGSTFEVRLPVGPADDSQPPGVGAGSAVP